MEQALCCEMFSGNDEEEEAVTGTPEASLTESHSVEMQIESTCVQEGIIEVTDGTE